MTAPTMWVKKIKSSQNNLTLFCKMQSSIIQTQNMVVSSAKKSISKNGMIVYSQARLSRFLLFVFDIMSPIYYAFFTTLSNLSEVSNPVCWTYYNDSMKWDRKVGWKSERNNAKYQVGWP